MSTPPRLLYLCLVALVLLSFNLSAQEERKEKKNSSEEEVQRLPEVKVRAPGRVEEKLIDVPAAASVLQLDEADLLGFTSVDDILRYEFGVYRRKTKGMMDTLAGVSLRGFKGRERTLCLYDEVPLHTGYTGAALLDVIVPWELERIEVVRGPYSALYGGHAMGGVVRLVPKKIPVKGGVSARLCWGDMETQVNYVSFSRWLFKERFGFRIGFKVADTTGYRSEILAVRGYTSGSTTVEVSGWRRTTDPTGEKRYYMIGWRGGVNSWHDETYFARFLLHIKRGWRMSLSGFALRGKYSYDNRNMSWLHDVSTGALVYNGDETDGMKVRIIDRDGTYYVKVREGDFLRGGGNRERQVLLWTLRRKQNHQDLKFWASAVVIPKDDWFSPKSSKAKLTGDGEGDYNNTLSHAYCLGGQWSRWLDRKRVLHLVVGGAYEATWAHTKTWTLSKWMFKHSSRDLVREAEGNCDVLGVYGQLLYDLMFLRFVLALRLDWWRTYDGYSFDVSLGAVKSATRTKTAFSPKFSILFKPEKIFTNPSKFLKASRLWLSYGHAFRSPSVYELYRTWVSSWGTVYEGNPSLEPERTWGGEVGFRLRGAVIRGIGATSVHLAYFRYDVSDLIYYLTIASGHNRRENIAKACIDGWEAEIRQSLTSWFSFFFNTTTTNSRIVENPAKPSSEGKQLIHVPRHAYNFGLLFRIKGKWSFALGGRFVGKVYTKDDNSDVAQHVPKTYEPFLCLDARFGLHLGRRTVLWLSIENLTNSRWFLYYLTPPRTISATVALQF